MRDAHDHSKLKWIRTELDSLLSQSSRALEDYAEGIGGKELIGDCIEKLHQVRGTLQLMQLYGAAMLAEEMEMLAIAIREDQVNQQEAATETLMLGLVHLPSYLEKLERGARDIPLLVLPMLNELRAARDASLLSEVALFAPELEQILGSDKIVGSANPELQELARRLRLKYHQGLIKWYREMDVDDGLKTIGSVLSELSQHAGTDKVSRLFKAGWAVTEGLREEGGSKPGFAFKELFGKLDRELKRIIDVGEEIAAEAPTNELLKNFLYYVASSSSEIPLLNEIRQEFGLKQGFFSKEEINLERESLQAFDQDLLGSLRIAIGADLTAIKDGLDLFIRSAENDVARLRELEVPTRKVADTLGMIGQGALRERLKRQADWLKSLADPESRVDEQMLMSMAGDILFIETSLDNLASLKQKSSRAGTGGADDARLLPEGEFEKLTDSVMHEAEVDMAKNRDAIINYINGPQTPELLEEVPARFRTVAGAFTIMNQTQASNLLHALSRFVEKTLLVGGELPPAEDLNRFADAMTSVEYFMEGVTEGRGVQPEILQIAEKALIELGVLDAPESAADVAGAAEDSEPATASAAADEAASFQVEPVLVLEAAEAGEGPVEMAAGAAAVDEIDPEILEIFLEEATEELDNIQTYLPRWCSDTQDSEALTTTRRSFHTLKGSGRLVGAALIGEFAWSIENLLNRVIEKTVEVSADLVALLQEAKEVLPRLIENQRSGSSVGDGVESLMARAFDLAGGGMPRPETVPAFPQETAGLPDAEQIESPADAFASAGLETEWPEQAPDDLGGLAMDEELADIYLPETRGHIEELNGFINDCRQDPDKCDLKGAGISRALHTLHGSAEMADVESIAEVSAALESFIKELIASDNRLADESVLSLIEECSACFSAILNAINRPDGVLPDWESLLDRIDEQAQAQMAAAAVETVPQAEQLEAQEDELQLTAPVEESVSEVDVVRLPTQREVKAPAVSIAGIDYDEIPGDEDLIEIFMEEARELLESVEQSLQEWRGDPENLAPLSELQRTLHTLKGGARLSGVMAMGDLSHAFETLLSEIDPQDSDHLADVMELSQLVSDRLAEQIEDIGNGPRVRRSDDLIQRLEQLSGGAVETAEAGLAPAAKPEALQEEEVQEAEEEEPQEEEPQALVSARNDRPALEQKSPRGRREQIRVQADLLDKLVNNAGEVSIYRARLEQQNNTLGFNLKELEQTVDRLRSQLRNLDIETEAQILFRYEREKEEREAPETAFDPLEMDRFSTIQQLSRSLLETVNDLTNINGYLEDLNKETETLLLQQARVATDLQDGLLHTRMVPFAQQVPRLQRVVRQTAASLGKKAELYVQGAEGELDRGVLDRMIGPLEHVLRNAVSHGIENPDRRKELGKKPTGSISLNLMREGNDIIVSVTDDGAGLDTDAIRRQAIDSGLLDAAAEVPDSVVIQFVLEHGFSTKREVTQISGRGVGLDVVIKEVKNLGGSLDIDSTRGEGTSFTIRLPLTLAISDALLVELDDEIYAVPHISIEGVVRVSKTELLNSYDGRSASFNYADHDYRVRYLGALLNTGQVNLSDQRKWYPLLLVRAGEHRIALQVDGLLGNRQIVVKPVGPQISSVRWISGGTILGDGRVALILDMTALVRMDATHNIPSQLELPPAIHAPPQNVVMVVDDSITVRKVTGRVLERNGMKVITAKDGVDAVAQLQEELPDVMLLDIEMPRMDGYELARHMRNTEELKSIPIIMITSRTGDKHRQLAMELGVRRYLGKPYQEAELLDNIYSVLAEESP
ncbi:MAG: Hpt domain-containing protein [Chromatiaceae bacterium]|nr:Hpt domain-containing protein [Chromatiaceae bacterium]MCP5447790.1 Hpt domain-containing protein [Chromatiaceae bacterium]